MKIVKFLCHTNSGNITLNQTWSNFKYIRRIQSVIPINYSKKNTQLFPLIKIFIQKGQKKIKKNNNKDNLIFSTTDPENQFDFTIIHRQQKFQNPPMHTQIPKVKKLTQFLKTLGSIHLSSNVFTNVENFNISL